MGGCNSVPGAGRRLSSGCVILSTGGKDRNLLFSKAFPDFPFSFTEQRGTAVRPQSRSAPKGTPALFNLLKRFGNFPHLRCCFDSGGIGAAPCSQEGSRAQTFNQLQIPQVTKQLCLGWAGEGRHKPHQHADNEANKQWCLAFKKLLPPHAPIQLYHSLPSWPGSPKSYRITDHKSPSTAARSGTCISLILPGVHGMIHPATGPDLEKQRVPKRI